MLDRQEPEMDNARTRKLSRRTVLGHMATLVGAGAIGLGGCDSIDYSPLIDQLVTLNPDPAAAATIGEAFLEESSTSRRRLAARLALELDWKPDLDANELTTRLLERIRQDFRDGKTVPVDAWILSQTEVWWAGLVAHS